MVIDGVENKGGSHAAGEAETTLTRAALLGAYSFV